MSTFQNIMASIPQASSLTPARIVEFNEGGMIFVSCDSESPRKILCNYLLSSEKDPVELKVGDQVLILMPSQSQDCGCVLGKLGAYNPPNKDRVRIHANDELSLCCGDASITIRSDGKILTKAVDIASIAKRTHRLRGGSVQIN